MSHMSLLASRSLRRAVATLALASPSRLRAPKTRTLRPLTTATAPSIALNPKPRPRSTTRSKGQPAPKPAPAPHPSAAATTRSTRSRNAATDHSSSSSRALRQQPRSRHSESSRTSHSSSSSQKKERPIMKPYELSRRLIVYCKNGDLYAAIRMLERAPRDSQNIKVWNTIIQQCMGVKKYKLAYSVFTDMKRRGFVPNLRTYATMMGGYASIDDWEPLTAQLKLVHSVYRQMRDHLDTTPDSIDDPADKSEKASFILYPIALYISILGKVGKYQKAFDVFHELDTTGPLAPHPKIYSSLLSILADRVDATDVDAAVIAESVSEAKYVWRRHVRSSEKVPLHDILPRSIEAMIKLLSRGNPSDHELMFDILRDLCELPGPSDGPLPSPPPSPQKKVWLTPWILREVLDGCIVAFRPEMTVHYAQSVMDSTELRHILRVWHLSKLVRAHNHLAYNGSALPSRAENVADWVEWMVAPKRDKKTTAPDERTMVSALELCHRCKDPRSAFRIVNAVMFEDAKTKGPSSLSFPVKAYDYLFRLAAMAGQDETRRCFELLNLYGSSVLDVLGSSSAVIERLQPTEKKAYRSLALEILHVFKPALQSSDHQGAEKEKPDEAWSDIRQRAQSFLRMTPRRIRKS